MPLQRDYMKEHDRIIKEGKKKEPTDEQPTFETLQEMEWERGGCEATDGCWVEPDGYCEHGHLSWLLYLDLM